MSNQVTVNNKQKSELPKLIDLVKDVDSYKKQDELNFLLNQPVPKDWISNHPYIKKEILNEQGQKIKVPYEYLAIDKVEYLLRRIFKRHRIEITGQGVSFNGVFVTVRVHVLNPLNNEWDFHDGIGAIQLQVKAGSSPANLNDINNGALSMAYPLAKTLAVKDACDHFGNLFGANLNRRDIMPNTLDKKLESPTEEVKRFEEFIASINSLEEVKVAYDNLENFSSSEKYENYKTQIRTIEVLLNTNKK
jgi:hypothetical protein